MLRRLQLCTVLFAWFLATGSQWDFVQVFAWGRMVAIYSQNMSLPDAVALTFRAEGKCDLCRFVESAKQQEDEQAATTPGGKRDEKSPLLAPLVAFTADFARERTDWRSTHAALPASERVAPPVPPPRRAVA